MESKRLAIFENNNFGKLRWIMRNGEPWFVANDIAASLGYADCKQAIRDHCNYAELFKGVNSTPLTESPRGITIIPESDVYALIFRSNLPKAIEFRKWVCEEVLPSIRKTGKYAIPRVAQQEENFRSISKKIELLEKLMQVAKDNGCYRAMAINELILHNTGWDILDEAGQNVLEALGKPEYTPKQIAKILGRSANSIDDALVQMGLQVYGLNQYHLTEKGLKYGYVYETNRRRNPRYPFQHISNIKWHPIIIEKLRLHFHRDSAKALELDSDSHFRMLPHTKTDVR